MKFVYDDGGRQLAGYRGDAGDCCPRAIAIATGLAYQQVYDDLAERYRAWRKAGRSRAARADRGSATPRNGTPNEVWKPYCRELGLVWTPTMQIGAGCKVHLREGELPKGRLVVAVSKHLTAVVDGVIRDTFDPSRGGTRCVYGFFSVPEGWQPPADKKLATSEQAPLKVKPPSKEPTKVGSAYLELREKGMPAIKMEAEQTRYWDEVWGEFYTSWSADYSWRGGSDFIDETETFDGLIDIIRIRRRRD